jgi:hypothetical protein
LTLVDPGVFRGEAVADNPVLAAIVEPTLRVLEGRRPLSLDGNGRPGRKCHDDVGLPESAATGGSRAHVKGQRQRVRHG